MHEPVPASMPIASQDVSSVMNEVWLWFLGRHRALTVVWLVGVGGCDWVKMFGPCFEPLTTSLTGLC